MTSENAALRERLSKSEAEVAKLRQQQAELESQVGETRALLEELRLSVERNKTEMREVRQELGATSHRAERRMAGSELAPDHVDQSGTVARGERVLVWLDPNIGNGENGSYVRQLRCVDWLSLTATASLSEALRALQLRERKPDAECRALTAGKGGEAFVRKLRASGVTCPVLVFCGNVAKHSAWAARYSNVEATDDTARMFVFATWQD